MAKLSTHGTEIARYFDRNARGIVSIRSDGVALIRRPFHGWKIAFRKKPDFPLDQWRERKLRLMAELPRWCREVRRLPSEAQLREWCLDCVCETLTGDMVEPDGHGPDGAPSWLLALGLI